MEKDLKKTVVILGGNSNKNIKWLEKMVTIYQEKYNVIPVSFESWKKPGADIDFSIELKKLTDILRDRKDYIIVAKSAGAVLSLIGIEKHILKPTLLVVMGTPLSYAEYRNIDVKKLYVATKGRTRVLSIQQSHDPQGSARLVESILPPYIPFIEVKGDDHAYTNVASIKKYVDAFVNLNTAFHPHRIDGKSLKDAIETVHANRHLYQYYNNWLSDQDNRILAFQHQNRTYVMKRTTVARANTEVRNALFVKSVVHDVQIQKYTVKVAVPYFIKVNKKTGYLVSEYFGKDINQMYGTDIILPHLDEVIATIQQKLLQNGLIYGGFLPRNTIINGSNLYMIDFEDVNEKKLADAETGYKISWSYFLKNLTYSVENIPDSNDQYIRTFNRVIGSVYENPYEVALAAESSGNGYKNDDIICTLSPYISLESEIVLDILLYAERTRQMKIEVAARLFALAERVRILAIIKRKVDIKFEVATDISKIMLEASGHEGYQLELRRFIMKTNA